MPINKMIFIHGLEALTFLHESQTKIFKGADAIILKYSIEFFTYIEKNSPFSLPALIGETLIW